MLYPGCINKEYKRNISHKNRGMNLENLINLSNEYYLENDIAIIYKKPTPILVCKVDYKNNLVKEGYYKTPSTLDYNGVYRGKYIDFDAKETESKTAFPIKNIHNHQINHIKNIIENNGIGFLIIRFNKLNKTYLLEGKDLISFINNNERKSIPLTFFEEHAYLIEEKYIPRVDYLKVVDSIIGGIKNEI